MRMINKCFRLSLFFLVLCSIVSCNVNKLPDTTGQFPSIPGSFNGTNSDTLNSANIKWKNYFTDTCLVHLIDFALNNNRDMKIALQKVEESRAGVMFSKGQFFPMVNAFGSAGVGQLGNYSAAWAGNAGGEYATGAPLKRNMKDYNLGIQSAWEIDLWGRLRNSKKAAVARYLSSVEGKNLVTTNLITEIADSYYDLLALDNRLKIIEQTIQLQENALAIVQAQKEAGVANELAVKQFKAQLLNSQGLEREDQMEITGMENKINFLEGRYPQPVSRDTSAFTDSIPYIIHTGVPSELLEHRPDVREAEYDLEASKADLKAAKAAFFPSLNITGTYGFDAFNPAYLFLSPESIAYTLAGDLAAPILNRNAIKADFKRAKAVQLEAMFNYQNSILNGYVEVYNELSDIKNLDKIYELKNREVDELTQAIETSTDLFKTGKASYLEVLTAEKEALQARLELIDTRRRQFQSCVAIYQSLGGGWN